MAGPWIPPDLAAQLEKLKDVSIVAITLYGEARSEPIEGIVAVANVIQHRARDGKKRWPQQYRGVCLQRAQFSCWHPFPVDGQIDRNHARVRAVVDRLSAGEVIADDPALEECAFVATGLLRGAIRDRCQGANHYHVATMQPRPAWAQRVVPVAQVAHHVFYTL